MSASCATIIPILCFLLVCPDHTPLSMHQPLQLLPLSVICGNARGLQRQVLSTAGGQQGVHQPDRTGGEQVWYSWMIQMEAFTLQINLNNTKNFLQRTIQNIKDCMVSHKHIGSGWLSSKLWNLVQNLYECWLILVRVSVFLVLNTDEVAHVLNVLLKVSDLQLQLMATQFPFQLLYAETQKNAPIIAATGSSIPIPLILMLLLSISTSCFQ